MWLRDHSTFVLSAPGSFGAAFEERWRCNIPGQRYRLTSARLGVVLVVEVVDMQSTNDHGGLTGLGPGAVKDIALTLAKVLGWLAFWGLWLAFGAMNGFGV